MTTYQKLRSNLLMGAAIVLLIASSVAAATGTLSPAPRIYVMTSTGAAINGACIWTYIAGTSTQATTWTDKALTVPNSNPVIATNGLALIYLQPGSSYKYIVENVCTPPAHGSVLYTQDNIDATPSSASSVDILGTAGEAISAGQVLYLSAGDGGKAAGQWFKADPANNYSSTAYSIGMAPSAITSLTTGTIRIVGQVTGLSALTIGLKYYAGAAGALTATVPTINPRLVGQADSTTSLIVAGNQPGPGPDNAVQDFRLTLTTGTPVTTADVTGASAVTIFCSPYTGSRISLSDSAGVPSIVTSAEFSIAVPATTATMYDVFAFNNNGVATLELLAWTNDTTRATAIVRTTTGAWTKTGDLTRRYLGSFRTGAVSGQTEDSKTKRYLWNYYQRRRRLLQVYETASYNYMTQTIRQANGNTANQVEAVVGVLEDMVELVVSTVVINSTTAAAQIGIGEGSTATTTSFSAGNQGGYQRLATGSASDAKQIMVWYRAVPGSVGRRVYSWNEYGENAGTTTWNSTTSAGSTPNYGIQGWIEG